MNTEKYCKNLENLDKIKAIRAIHEAYLQLRSLDTYENRMHWNNQPAISALEECLEDSGHIGFND
jgi:cystathionine beta-lyase/cystathionine gamma-synthase